MMIRDVIIQLGGVRRLARRLGHRNASTVQGWWERGVIPAHQQAHVLHAAREASVPVQASDLIPQACHSMQERASDDQKNIVSRRFNPRPTGSVAARD
ncbi:carph-isopro domain-containing protein [Sphingomonas parapaucimobilis]|uniref:carph-isopro domain-containing protein n=1 Tax=Sphingomonas parapaucimobilis TaxID=28213 RepID=UPI0039EA78FC